MGRLYGKFFIGGLAGLLAWMLCEPMAPRATLDQRWASWENTFVLVLGALIGMAVGGLDGYSRGGKRHTGMGLGLGLLFGAIGATFGHGLGGVLARIVFGNSIFAENYNILQQIPARILAFVPLGAALGAAIGGSSLTFKRTVQGAIGGAIGAAIAGASFDLLGAVLGNFILQSRGQERGEVGTPGRAMMAVLLGAGIGLFIGLVERYARSAWLRLSLGRNEGREWSIDSAQTFIGRSEGAQVPLFGDPNIAPIHASIQKHGRDYVLVDGGSPMGTYVNGQRIQQVPLMHGAQIQIGSFILQFLLKNQPAPVGGYEAMARAGYPLGGMPGPGMPTQMPTPGPMPGMPTQVMPGQPGGGYPMPGQPTMAHPAMGQPMPGQPMPGQPTQAFPSAQPMAQPTVAYGGAMGSGYQLVAVDGPLMGQRFPVGGTVEIGRETAGIRMPQDANASRRHAAVSPGMGGLAVQDLGSTNGTFVNGQRVSQATAGPGDMIKVGSTTFRVEPA